MDLIFILGAVQAFFLSIIAFWKKNNHTGDIVLSIWLAFMGLHLLHHYLLTTGFLFDYPHILGIGLCFPLLEGPLMYWYVQVMVNESGKFKAKYLLHLLPFLSFTIFFLFDFYFLSTAEKLDYYKMNIIHPSVVIRLLAIMNVSVGPIYVIWSIILLKKFRKRLADKFSYTEKISLDWLKVILFCLGFVWITVIIANVLGSFPILKEENITDDIVFTSVSLAVFFIGIYGIKQQSIFITIPGSRFTSYNSEIEKPPITTKEKKQFQSDNPKSEKELTKLVLYMEDEKPFLNPELNIGDLANKLQIQSHQLSKLINNHLNKKLLRVC